MKTFKVILVDDHSIFRNGLKLLLNGIGGIEVVAEAGNGKEFLQLLKENVNVDLVFMDVNMPVLDGISTTEEATKMRPGLKIIALSTFNDNDTLKKMIYAGVEGYMLKNSNLDEFKKAIEKVMAGNNYFSDILLSQITQNFVQENHTKPEPKPELSKRECEVLELICKGFSNQKIGEQLNISDRTVERHKTNLLQKTETQNTVNLVIYAFKHQLVSVEDS